MIFTLRKAWAASSMISYESLDSAMFSLSCLMPLPPVLGVPFLSITLSHSFLASLPPFSFSSRASTTGNSPRSIGCLAGSIVYLSILSRSRFTPGTVSTSPSKEALIWNSLKRQAMTLPVVALESDLVGHNDWGVDGGADQGVADDVEVCLQRGGRVADRNTPVNEAGEVSLGSLHGFREGLQLLNFDFLLLLGDGDILQLAAVFLHTALNHLEELGLISFDEVPGDGSKLCIFSNLVWRPGTDWLAVDIHVGLLPQVKPDDGAVLGVDRSGDLLEDILDALECRLASGVDLVAGDPVEVRGTRQRVGQLLHLVELVGHGRSLPYLRVVRHLGEPGRQGLTEEVLDGAREKSARTKARIGVC